MDVDQSIKKNNHPDLSSRAVIENRSTEEKKLWLADMHNKLRTQKLIHKELQIERDAALAEVIRIKRSNSWRLTAPLRVMRYGCSTTRTKIYNFFRWMLPKYLLNKIRANRKRMSNSSALIAIIKERCEATQVLTGLDVMRPPIPMIWPEIDISIVTYNSQHWIDAFVHSLLALEYPKEKITIRFVDNSSTDSTLHALKTKLPKLQQAGFTIEIMQRPNYGFGAGHNIAIRSGSAPFCLVTNIDLTFEPNALGAVVATALVDDARAAAWEFHQKPYEHPKFYDPITGTTNWNSHACVLLRRTALDKISGYDENLFMYGEDVEMSYRLRRSGYLLRYCPTAVVWHYTYESEGQVKPLQYTGSTFANLYLRLKYGTLIDICKIPLLALRLLAAPEAYPGSRPQVLLNLKKLITLVPNTLRAREPSQAFFPFRNWDYDLTRDGAFVKQESIPNSLPLVSIITRTYRGREVYLRQALLSVAHQTWGNLEHIIVEDGGDTMRFLVDEVAAITGRMTLFIANGKLGRSNAGNAGLAMAKGRWCLFLDDDDLLFADHIESLASALFKNPNAVASYSLAWEVITDTKHLTAGKYTEISYNIPPYTLQDFDYEILRHHNFMPIQSVLFERELYVQHKGFEENMDALEDWILWARYAYGNQFVYVPKVTSMFRTPFNSVQIQQRLDAFSKAYPLAIARIEEHIAKADQIQDVTYDNKIHATKHEVIE